MEYTKEQLAEAYSMVNDAEKDMVEATETALTAFLAALDTVLASVPAGATNTPVISFVTQVKSQIQSITGYQLASLKVQYGLGVAPIGTATPTPAP